MGPLKFHPLLKRIRWGGRRLATLLGKRLGPESDYAESWELCDHGADQSIVSDGAWAGLSLGELVRKHADLLLGNDSNLQQFPLLLKFLDAHDRLSVQVHPNDQQARRYNPDENGKTEAWVILAVEAEGCVYAGLKPGIGRLELESAIQQGFVEQTLHRVPVTPGNCLLIPAGTVHAIGEGVLLAEVQQSSDLTFRLFDWNRLGTDGRPRPLHIAESLDCIDFSRGPISPVVPRLLVNDPGHVVEELVRSPYFVIRRHAARTPFQVAAEGHCVALMAVAGQGTIASPKGPSLIALGETVLLPATGLPAQIEPAGELTILEVFWDTRDLGELA